MDKMNSPTSEDCDPLGGGQGVGLYCGALLLAMYYVNSRKKTVRKLPVLIELPECSPDHSPYKGPLCPTVCIAYTMPDSPEIVMFVTKKMANVVVLKR